MNTDDIGIVIRKRRDAKGITQRALSEMSGVHLRTINNLEAGKGNPSIDVIQKIAYVLNLEIIVRVA